jgi:putative transposase
VAPDQLLIHTDQGSQYRANDYLELLQQGKINCSMSAKGCCWDHEVGESFISTLKLELDLDEDREDLLSPQQLQRDWAFWIEGYDNRERRHSAIGYLSPIDYEQVFIADRAIIPENA